MVDIDRLNDILNNNLKLKILNLLSMLPIKNRTIVEECKLYTMVKRLSSIDGNDDEKFNKINYSGLIQNGNFNN